MVFHVLFMVFPCFFPWFSHGNPTFSTAEPPWPVSKVPQGHGGRAAAVPGAAAEVGDRYRGGDPRNEGRQGEEFGEQKNR